MALRLRRDREYAALWIGQAVSSLGPAESAAARRQTSVDARAGADRDDGVGGRR